MSKKDNAGKFIAGMLFGGLVGGIIALLYAPSSGKKLRKKIGNKTEDILTDAEEFYKSGKEKAEQIIKDSREKASTYISEAKKKIISN